MTNNVKSRKRVNVSGNNRPTMGASRRGFPLVHAHQLPDFLKDNEYLLERHRPQLNSIIECLKSAFVLHTETWNIWTHFIGTMGTAVLMVYYVLSVANTWPDRTVFSIFFCGAIFCMGASTLFHTFGCRSEGCSRILAKLDYCGVISLIVTSFAPWVYYGFYCQPLFQVTYLMTINILGALSIYVVLQERFRKPQYRSLRAGLFIGLGLTGLLPGVHYIVSAGPVEAFGTYSWLLLMAMLYIAGGLIYAARIPERFFPGSCDVWWQSHQIMHLCVMGGVITCYTGAYRLARHTLADGQAICALHA